MPSLHLRSADGTEFAVPESDYGKVMQVLQKYILIKKMPKSGGGGSPNELAAMAAQFQQNGLPRESGGSMVGKMMGGGMM